MPFTGDLLAFATAAFVYVVAATAMGLLISSFMTSQIAAIFGTTILTLLPATQFSGMTDPVSSLQGAGALVARGAVMSSTQLATYDATKRRLQTSGLADGPLVHSAASVAASRAPLAAIYPSATVRSRRAPLAAGE